METKELNLIMHREEAIAEAGDILKNGGVAIIPTETVYGLAADVFNENAVAKIFEAKGRPQDNPVIDYHIILCVGMVVVYCLGGFERLSLYGRWSELSLVRRFPILQ